MAATPPPPKLTAAAGSVPRPPLPLPVVAIVTSDSCMHCILLRGASGELSPPPPAGTAAAAADKDAAASATAFSWSEPAFAELLLGGGGGPAARFRVFSVHLSEASTVADAREFVLRRDSSGSGRMRVDAIDARRAVPPVGAFAQYAVSFPCAFAASAPEWDAAVQLDPAASAAGSMFAEVIAPAGFVGPARMSGFSAVGTAVFRAPAAVAVARGPFSPRRAAAAVAKRGGPAAARPTQPPDEAAAVSRWQFGGTGMGVSVVATAPA